jgi:peroxiredoxin
MNQVFPGYLLLLSIVFLSSGCNKTNTQHTVAEVNISGKLDVNTPVIFTLEELTFTDVIALDTITTNDEGYFNHNFFIDHAGFYRLRFSDNDFIDIAADPGQNIYITGNYARMKSSYSVAGSEGSQILWQVNRMIAAGSQKADSLRRIYRSHKYNPQQKELIKSIKHQYESLKEQQVRFIINIIDNNPESLASILALYQIFDDRLLLDEKKHLAYYEKLSRSLGAAYPQNKHVINLKKRVNDLKREEQDRLQNEQNLAVGSPAPDIILPDPKGNQVSLSSFRNNLVLIDFWATWCPPCHEANSHLKNLYRQYNANGFEIYSISLDRTKDQWVDVIKKDDLNWTQVSDLRFMNSPVVNTYNVTEVPHYILIDRKGNIISRNFNLQQLESLIKENI